jgi:hypothetical protein
MSKPKLQGRLASLSFSEKIKILEKLRDREKAIASAGLRRDKRDDVISRRPTGRVERDQGKARI